MVSHIMFEYMNTQTTIMVDWKSSLTDENKNPKRAGILKITRLEACKHSMSNISNKDD